MYIPPSLPSSGFISTHSLTRRRDKDSGMEGFPTRSWSIEIYLLNEHGEQVPASVFDKVTYELHPSFEDRAVQSASPVPVPFPLLPCTTFLFVLYSWFGRAGLLPQWTRMG